MKTDKKVIFVGGTSYSGSTMLDMMLSNNPAGFSVGEVYRLFHPTRPHHFNPQCGCNDPSCDFWKKMRRAGETNLYTNLFSIHQNISFIVDSSKNPFWIKKQEAYLNTLGIKVFHVLIWKEPAAFAHSMNKRNRKGWQKAWINYHRLYFTLIPDYVSVAYAELVREPEKQLYRLCRKAGVSHHMEQQRFWKKKHHTLFGNDSAKTHLSKKNAPIEGRRLPADIKKKRQSHRSIYHDTSYLAHLSKKERHAIAATPHIQSINAILTDRQTPGQKIKYTPFDIAIKKIAMPIMDTVRKQIALHTKNQD